MVEAKYIIGTLHFIFSLLVSSYSFIFSKNLFDYIYIYYAFFVIISWSMCNGECIITYLIKRNDSPDYVPGRDVLNNDDMYIFPISNNTTNAILNILMMIWLFSIYIVMVRNKYPVYIPAALITIWIIYKFLLHSHTNHHDNANFHFYQTITQFILITILAITIYHTKIKSFYLK